MFNLLVSVYKAKETECSVIVLCTLAS